MGPALRGLGRLDELDQRQAAAELLEGADPVGSIEDQAASALRGDYHRVALFPLVLDALAQAQEAVFVVSLVQDQVFQPHEAEVV